MPSDEPLSEEELSAIELRAGAATPGPWVARLETRQGIGGASFVQLRPDAPQDDEFHLTRTTDGRTRTGPDPATDADLDFIAAARQDVPRLVAEVRRLREALERAQPAG
ncbi:MULTISPECIES: hypothetical protein [Streptomycetaceae]|uniref:hypothetical protein n=1 Tax=Streptomycetaceae TaxID=2062 RepID=UPI00093E61F1|nr:hypothetical protein [Streptomyces sp. CB02056]OKH97175.1 hypothetical protein AMK13_38720 [Streptomyces sp. CB02056]